MGVGVLASGWIWRRPLGHREAFRTLAACSFICAVAVAGPVLAGANLVSVYASAAAMGASMFIAPSSMAVLARQMLPSRLIGKALMLFSLVFSIGQAAGSWFFGRAADSFSLTWVLAIASAGLLCSALLAFSGVDQRYIFDVEKR